MLILELVKKGDFYRQNDLLVKIKENHYIISSRFDAGIDMIESGSNAQRRSQPIKYSNFRYALQSLGVHVGKDEEIKLVSQTERPVFM